MRACATFARLPAEEQEQRAIRSLAAPLRRLGLIPRDAIAYAIHVTKVALDKLLEQLRLWHGGCVPKLFPQTATANYNSALPFGRKRPYTFIVMNPCLLLLVAVALSGCLATPYQSTGMTGGVSHTAYARDQYQIRSSGNGFTSSERVSDFALLHAAEVTLAAGFSHFVIVNSAAGGSTHTTVTQATTRTTTVVPPTAQLGAYNVPLGVARSSSVTTGGDVQTTFKPDATLLIRCFNGDRQGALDAEFLANSLRAKYKFPPRE